MRRRVIGAALTVLGVLVLLFKPAHGVSLCADSFVTGSVGCRDQGGSSLWGWVDYPPGWNDTLAWPMFIIGVVLVVTGIVLLVMRRRSRGSPNPAR
jgi:uncharacterized membrane protein